MSRIVFVAGAGGYIGLINNIISYYLFISFLIFFYNLFFLKKGEEVCIAFRRAGFKVYGLVRKELKVKTLIKNEIIPVVGYHHHYQLYFLLIFLFIYLLLLFLPISLEY